MNIPNPIKVNKRNVLLVQAVSYMNTRSDSVLVKGVFVGIREEVKAVVAVLAEGGTIILDSIDIPRLYPDRLNLRIQQKELKPYHYQMAEVFYPLSLQRMVAGASSTIARNAFAVFQETYGSAIPLLEEFSGILWDMANTHNYVREIDGVNLPENETAFFMDLPEPEIFEQHLMFEMPRIYDLAKSIARGIPDNMAWLKAA